jgi:hypothetical protein
MTLTETQLVTTALTLISEHLEDLLNPANEINDWIDKKLCEQHCPGPGGCERTEAEWDAELAAVKQEIIGAVGALREALVHRLNERSMALAKVTSDD